MNDAYGIHTAADYDPFSGNSYFAWAAAQTQADRKAMRSWKQGDIASYFTERGYSFADFQTLEFAENRSWRAHARYVYPGDDYPALPAPAYPPNLSATKGPSAAWGTPTAPVVDGNSDAVVGGS